MPLTTIEPAQPIPGACPDCDLEVRPHPPPAGESLHCPRCGALIARSPQGNPAYCLAFALSGLILFPLANGFHLMSFALLGNSQANFVWSGIAGLWDGGLHGVALLVLFCVVIAPLLLLLSLVYLYLPGQFGRRARHAELVHRCLHTLSEWSMIDVFLLGALVSFIKLSQLATVNIDNGLFLLLAMLAASTMAWLSHLNCQQWPALDAGLQKVPPPPRSPD